MSRTSKSAGFSRRQFLRGAGGFSLAIPAMTSLFPKGAFAADDPYSSPPRFVGMASPHGGVWGTYMFPEDDLLVRQQDLGAGHTVFSGDLVATQEGSRRRFCRTLSADASLLQDDLVRRLNVLRGLDFMMYMGHHTGGHLGNFARNDGNGGLDLPATPTVDQMMAWSPDFYRDLSAVTRRSIHIGETGWDGSATNRELSWGYSSPSQQRGEIVPVLNARSSLTLFQDLFNPAGGAGQTPVVDRVLENYRQLRNGAFGDAARLSAVDRQRLDDHMDRLSELERRLTVESTCKDLPTPSTDASRSHAGYGRYTRDLDALREWYQLYNDVIVAGFMCNSTRVATVSSWHAWSIDSDGPCEWHQDVAHQTSLGDATNPSTQQLAMADAQQRFFEGVFLDLANKLNVEEAFGRTYLDNSLLVWTQESGQLPHAGYSIPVITAGSASGFFRTGLYCDYRSRNNRSLINSWDEGYARLNKRPGLLYNQWLSNTLQAMGLHPSDYSTTEMIGYGPTDGSESTESWPSHIQGMANQILPFLAM